VQRAARRQPAGGGTKPARQETSDMPSPAIAWPRKTREIHNHHMDSTIWNDFRFRDDDIIIAS
jgi:hypothetical protein